MFTHNCFIRKNTSELRECLDSLGMKCSSVDTGTAIFCRHGEYYCLSENKYNSDEFYLDRWSQFKCDFNENSLGCGTDEDLFLAIAALRDDSSFMQWFIYTKDLYDEDEELVHYKGEWDLCLEHRVADDDFYPELRRKATAKEIIKHFRYTELCLLSLVLSERIPKS